LCGKFKTKALRVPITQAPPPSHLLAGLTPHASGPLSLRASRKTSRNRPTINRLAQTLLINYGQIESGPIGSRTCESTERRMLSLAIERRMLSLAILNAPTH
jgi:hypothetical protein